MRMKSRLLRRVLSPFERMLLMPMNMNVTGRLAERFMLVLFYSTRGAVNEYNGGDKGIGKLALAKNLANLVDESTRYPTHETAREGHDDGEIAKVPLAKSLASLVQESYNVHEQKSKPTNRLEIKRFLEMRIKKKVKEQFMNGKFHNLMLKVIANPNTLKDAYDCIRLTSNVDLVSDGDNLLFESIAEQLASGNFDIAVNTYTISTRGSKVKKEELVFPNLKLRVVQEAIRIVLEVVYRPHFSKISHGCRSGRSHLSALKYVLKEIKNPEWWFTIILSKKLDHCILSKLGSSMGDKIEDPGLFDIIRNMFDARVLNLEFGGFSKGQGLPQEGALSPVLMNIYLDLFDREFYRLSMQYETSDSCHGSHSNLRGWFRRQINGNDNLHNSGVRVHCCRFMDEIFFAVSGPKEVALSFKAEIESYLKNSLYLDFDNNQNDILACSVNDVKFLGTLIKRQPKETPAFRAVHKLKDKVKMFSEQKRDSWDEGAIRIGKKWLAHGLKKVKESEIKQLADTNSVLYNISRYRKPGMKTDHWYKTLLKIWMQDIINVKNAASEEIILAKHIVEPSLPQELRDSYYEFEKRAQEYVSSETASTLSLLPGPTDSVYSTKIIAPVKFIMKRLHRYGLTNREGYGRPCYMLVLLDDNQIIDWFTGLTNRWLRWYVDCDNFSQLKHVISDQLRMSCVRTLAAKYRIYEAEIEKKFDQELSRIPSAEDIELEDDANVEFASQRGKFDGASTYGINYSGLCLVSLARMVSESRPCRCFVIGCSASVSCVYTLHVMEKQKFPAWKTGFSSCIHPSLHRRRVGMCKQHLRDLFLGDISLQSIDFGSWR